MQSQLLAHEYLEGKMNDLEKMLANFTNLIIDE